MLSNIQFTDDIEFISGTFKIDDMKNLAIVYYRSPHLIDDDYLSATKEQILSLKGRNRNNILRLRGDFNLLDIN